MKQIYYKFTEEELIHLAIKKTKEREPTFDYIYQGKSAPIAIYEPKDNSMTIKFIFEEK